MVVRVEGVCVARVFLLEPESAQRTRLGKGCGIAPARVHQPNNLRHRALRPVEKYYSYVTQDDQQIRIDGCKQQGIHIP